MTTCMSGKEPMNKILIDTNILVYLIDEDSKFHHSSKTLIQNPDHQLYTTSKNLAEFLVVLTRSGEVSVSINDALALLDDLLRSFHILYPSKYSANIFKELLFKYKPHGLKIHDFEIVSIGLANGVHKVATINKDDFKNINEIELIDF